MQRILIVDDEKIERNGIKFLLKQLKLPLEVYEASNGKEAYDFLQSENGCVDILLTDVKMPFMDGIQLIKLARELSDELQIIIFSGYSEFEYAKLAMKMGVVNYILKPVDPNEFEKTLSKVIHDLEEKKKKKNKEQESIGFVKEHVLYSVVNGVPIEDIHKKVNHLVQLDFIEKYKRMFLVEFESDFFGNVGSDFVEDLKGDIKLNFQYLNLNLQQSLLFFEEEKDVDYKNLAEQIYTFFVNRYGRKCFIGVSHKLENATKEIAKEFEALEELLENKFYQVQSHLFFLEQEENEESLEELDDDTLMKSMKQDMKMKDISSLRKHFTLFYEKYKKKNALSQIYIKFLFSNLLKEIYTNLPNRSEQIINKEIDKLYKANDIQILKEIVESSIEELEQVYVSNPQMIHREIESIKNYIYENYDKELSVEQLAEQVFMAPSYLSHVFKKETGQNLSKFIKSYRMEKAKQMLEETHNKIVNISNAVGYSNVSYFCQSFREYFGVSPQKFRNQGEQNEA